MTCLALMQWRPHLGPLGCAVVMALAAGWVWFVYQRLLTRLDKRQALVLLVPKALLLLLLLIALFEPVWMVESREATRGRLLALLDTSSSMDVRDDGKTTRLARARETLNRFEKSFPAGVVVEEMDFDTELHPAGRSSADKVRGTDVGGALAAVSERKDISSYLGVVLLTDGGDETVENPLLPSVPLYAIGFGANPSTWNDVAISGMEHPATAEKDVEFEVNVDLSANNGGGGNFARGLSSLSVTLEEDRAGKWAQLETKKVDISNMRARAKFAATGRELGLHRYRASLEAVNGELTPLNNTRHFTVDVQKKSLHVLFFTRELGMDFKMIRNELARDPGIAFTALFRTVSEKFTLQGDRLPGDDQLEAGFPTSEKTLKLYDGLILGPFPAEDWTAEQMQALVKYVEGGGVALFLGGADAFGRGKYAKTPLAALFPWQITDAELELSSGTFPVKVPLASSGHPILGGVEEALIREGAAVESLNNVEGIKPGAVTLIETKQGARAVPVVAVHNVGKGKVLAVASNTLWKWATRGEGLRAAFGLFWRQAVRNLTGKEEGGRVFTVKWDKEAYRPGEQATPEIHVAGQGEGGGVRFAATLTRTNEGTPLAVEPVQGQPNTYNSKVRLRARGDYLFKLSAYRGDALLENYEKTLRVAPLADEGSRLELDEDFLRHLAERASGAYYPEKDADQFLKRVATGLAQKSVFIESSLVQAGPWFALLVLGLLIAEWFFRRRKNLI
jgi:uncharacterized membrane protein